MKLRGFFLVLAVIVAAGAVVPALASRFPAPSERRAIRAAMTAYINKPGSPAAKANKVVRIRISTVDKRWATAETFAPNVGAGIAILHHIAARWKVVAFGTGGFECGPDGPKAVLKDLIGGCIPPSSS
jgi:hypothetical protein